MDAVTADLEIDFSKVEQLGERVISQLSALREVAPIYWSEQNHAWIITGHAEVLEAFDSTKVPLSAARHKLLNMIIPDEAEGKRLIPNLLRYFPQMLINLDAQEHTRIRKLMMKAFSGKVAEDYRPRARKVICEVLDRLKGREEVEFVEDVALQITARNIMRITGIQDEEFYLPRLKQWSTLATQLGSGQPTREILSQADAAFAEMAEAFTDEIRIRRDKPSEDFVSMLVHAGEGDDKFNDDELIGELILILLAGHDTTVNTMALSINALSRDEAAREYMRINPESILNSVMELMRYIAMSNAQGRIVAEDFEWKGHQLKKGQFVNVMIAGANRDPKVFADPERLDLTRRQDNNVTFAPGTHHCIGHLVAKMQLTEFFPEFLRRYESFDVLDKELQFLGSLTFRGPKAMHLRLKPRD